MLNHPILRLLRWHAPQGASFLFLPCLWGLTAASRGFPPFKLILLFAAGAFFTRSAGCIYNDWVDRDVDPHIKRTQTRPLAARSVSTGKAFFLIALLLLLSLGIVLQLSLSSQITAFCFAGLVLLYPWLKRFTYWPQAYLGLLFSSGALVSWLAVKPDLKDITATPVLLFLVSVLWTLVYDTIYAYQDYEDDQKLGVKSSALWLGASPQRFFYGCWGGMLVLLIGIGFLEALHWPYGLGLICLIFHWTWQARQIKKASPRNPFLWHRLFKANQNVGILIFLSLWAGF